MHRNSCVRSKRVVSRCCFPEWPMTSFWGLRASDRKHPPPGRPWATANGPDAVRRIARPTTPRFFVSLSTCDSPLRRNGTRPSREPSRRASQRSTRAAEFVCAANRLSTMTARCTERERRLRAAETASRRRPSGWHCGRVRQAPDRPRRSLGSRDRRRCYGSHASVRPQGPHWPIAPSCPLRPAD